MTARLIFPLLRAYAAHAGLGAAEAELRADLERRLALMPALTRAGLALGAELIFWAGPLFLIGRGASFAALSAEEKEELLRRLQQSRRLPIRGMYLGVKSLLLGVCYGRPAWTRRLGYLGGVVRP